jgi:hypothetical protein
MPWVRGRDGWQITNFGFKVQCCSRRSSLRRPAVRQAAITIVYRLYGER